MAPILIKTFTEESHAFNFSQGNLILRCSNYFRMCEDKRGDKNESTVKHLGSNNIPTITTLCNDTLIFSFWVPSSNSEDIKSNHFGEYHVKNIEPCKLFYKIREILQSILLRENNAYFGKINYMNYGDDTLYLPSKSLSLEKMKKAAFFCDQVYVNDEGLLQGSPGIECCFTKNKMYESEREARMVFLVKTKGINKSPNLPFEMHLLKEETKYIVSFRGEVIPLTIRYSFPDYESWNTNRLQHSNPTHWIEVHLQGIPSEYFHLISPST